MSALSTMPIIPIGERVLLEQTKKEEKTSGGIYLPEDAQKEKKEGHVISVGMFKDGKELPLKKGDAVIYGGYSNEEIEYEGQKYVLVEFKDILAKVEKEIKRETEAKADNAGGVSQ